MVFTSVAAAKKWRPSLVGSNQSQACRLLTQVRFRFPALAASIFADKSEEEKLQTASRLRWPAIGPTRSLCVAG